jgi:hypothetical protein
MIDALRKVFTRFRVHNLKLKPKTCFFFKQEIEFLGKKVNEHGVMISPSKIECLERWPVPRNIKQLQSFLGFLNYHRSHIPDFAKTAAGLYDLTTRKEFHWLQEHQVAFDRLKNLAVKAPLLHHPDPDGLFILDTDASGHQIGAALYQVQNGDSVPIAFASHVLLKHQRRYCTTRKELLAVVKFCRHFRHYLLGHKFLCRTDHNSLTWLLRFKHIEGQLARCLEELSQYDITLLHRKGSEHLNADALSRIQDTEPECDCYHAGCEVNSLPCGGCNYCTRAHLQWERFSEDVDDIIPLATRSVNHEFKIKTISTSDQSTSNWLECLSRQQLQDTQFDDPDVSIIIYWLQHDYEPSIRELQLCSAATRSYWLNKGRLIFKEGVFYYSLGYITQKLGTRDYLIVPISLREKVLSACHYDKNSGHLGFDNNLERLRKRY